MSRKFKTSDYELALNQAITLSEALPPNHLARFVVIVIEQLDLSCIYVRYAPVGGEAIAPHNMTELRTRVDNGVARTRNSAGRLAACLAGCELSWK